MDRPRRYWRDAVAQSGQSEKPPITTSAQTQPTPAERVRAIRIPGRNQSGAGEQGGRIRFLQRDREGGGGFHSGGTLPSRTLIGIIGGVLLLIALLVFALNQGGEDTDDDGNLTPTQTVESVLNPADEADGPDAGAPSTPGGGEDADESATEPASEDASESTGENDQPQPGGDNQLDPPDDPSETPAA